MKCLGCRSLFRTALSYSAGLVWLKLPLLHIGGEPNCCLVDQYYAKWNPWLCSGWLSGTVFAVCVRRVGHMEDNDVHLTLCKDIGTPACQSDWWDKSWATEGHTLVFPSLIVSSKELSRSAHSLELFAVVIISIAVSTLNELVIT